MGDLKDDLLEILYGNSIKIFKYKKLKLTITNDRCIISKKNNNLWTVIDEVIREEYTGLRKVFLGEKESNYMYYRRVTNKFIERARGY